MPLATFARYLHAMLGNSLHIVGYDQARVVDVDQFHSAWHVSCPAADMDDTTVLRRPRQWLDINGSLIKPAWVRCSTKVYSVIAQRPGISEVGVVRHPTGRAERINIGSTATSPSHACTAARPARGE